MSKKFKQIASEVGTMTKIESSLGRTLNEQVVLRLYKTALTSNLTDALKAVTIIGAINAGKFDEEVEEDGENQFKQYMQELGEKIAGEANTTQKLRDLLRDEE